MTALDCAAVELRLAAGASADDPDLAIHLAGCEVCRVLASTPSVDDEPELAAADPTDYVLGAEVARGGMGRIVLARDLRIGRELAVKELVSRNPALAARFEREARLTARLQHPGIVPIYEIGRWPDGTPFYAMRLVRGQTLREAMPGAITLADRLALVERVLSACDAIAFAHGQRVIHRDLSPSNILVGEHGETVVIDWGLAKELDDGRPDDRDLVGPSAAPPADAELTAAGAVIGTAAYMAPEQARGEAVDPRADVYAVGAILYHVLAGAPPYLGDTAAVLAQRHAGSPRRLAEVTPAAPRDLVSIVDKAMAAAPADRYADAAELARELRRFRDGRLVDAHAYTVGERLRRWTGRHRLALATVVVTVVSAAIAFAVVVRQRDRARTAERTTQAALGALYLAEGLKRLDDSDLWNGAAYVAAAYRKGRDSSYARLLVGRADQLLSAVEVVVPPLDAAGPVYQLHWGEADRELVIVTLYQRRFVDVATGQVSNVDTPLPDGWHFPGLIDEPPGPARFRLELGDEDTADDDRVAALVLDEAGATVARIEPGGPIVDADISADGRLVVTCRRDGRIELWRVADATPLGARSLPEVRGCGLDRDATHVVAHAPSERVMVWPVLGGGDGHVLLTGPHIGRPVLGNGGLVVIHDHGGVEVWDGARGRVMYRLKGSHNPSLSRDLRRLAVTRPDGGVAVIALDRLGPTTRWSARAHGLDEILATSDAGTRVLGLAAGEPALWDTETGPVGLPALRRPATLSGDGGRVAAWSERGAVEILEVPTARVVRTLSGFAAAPRSLQLSHDGGRLLVVSADGRALVLATDTGTVVTDGGRDVTGARMDEEASWLLVCHGVQRNARLHDLTRGSALRCEQACTLAEGLYGHRIASARDAAGVAVRFDVDGFVLERPGEVDAIDRSGTRAVLLSDRRVFWHRLLFFQRRGLTQSELPGGAWELAIAPDLSFSPGSEPVERAAMSPDGWMVVTETGIWTPDGTRARPFAPSSFGAPLSWIRFTRDGTTVVALDRDGELTRWSTPLPRAPAAEVARRFAERSGVTVDSSGAVVPVRPPPTYQIPWR